MTMTANTTSNDTIHVRVGISSRKLQDTIISTCGDSVLGKEEETETPRFLRMSACDKAREMHPKEFEGSALPDKSFDIVPKFQLLEISQGKILGKGSFAWVYQVNRITINSSYGSNQNKSGGRGDRCQVMTKEQKHKHIALRKFSPFRDAVDTPDEEVSPGEMENRKFIAEHCIRNGGDSRYAIKCLSPSTIQDSKTLLQGVADMATETRILSSLEHPHVVKLRAIAQGPRFRQDYFFLLDRLYDTLQKRILVHWEKRQKRSMGISGRLSDRKGRKRAKLYEERIVAAYDLSSGLAYLHKNRIIHRDIKPDNIGFDLRGDIKIFDFGLAREIPLEGADENGLYHYTGMCGSPRYMAPEVGLKQSYNESCDVYSFAIVFWEMLALKRPYEKATMGSLRQHVWGGKCKRPVVDRIWTVPVKLLLKRAWNANMEERPQMKHIEIMLRKEAIKCRNGDDRGLDHDKRRSTYIFSPETMMPSASGGTGSPRGVLTPTS